MQKDESVDVIQISICRMKKELIYGSNCGEKDVVSYILIYNDTSGTRIFFLSLLPN